MPTRLGRAAQAGLQPRFDRCARVHGDRVAVRALLHHLRYNPEPRRARVGNLPYVPRLYGSNSAAFAAPCPDLVLTLSRFSLGTSLRACATLRRALRLAWIGA